VTAFVDCLFRYADEKTYVNLRAFHDLKDGAPSLFIEPVKIGAPDFIERVCERIREAAAHPEPHVFCPPVCVFTEPNGAATGNLAEGIALSVECDANGGAARKRLTSILGVVPTVTVASGGTWLNPETNRLEAKLHLHWRLVEPTRDAADHEKLTEGRALAAELVSADKSATSIVHPLRWPGSWHRKTNSPRIARLKTNPDSEIELGEALERLREACPPKTHVVGNGHDRDEEGRDLRASLPELEAALSVMPNEATWDEWNRVGMAAWVASEGKAFDAFDDWSKKSSKYNDRNTRVRWNHYFQSPPSRVGAGTIFHLAAQADSDWRRKIKIPEAPDWQKRILEDANRALAEQERALAEQTRIDELACKSRVEYDRERKKAAADLKIRTKTLDDEVEKRRRQRGTSTKKPPDDKERLKELERAAGDLIREPDILERFGKAVQAAGLVGETNNAKILYLAQTTRLFERPVSVAIKGISAGGKSFTVESVLRFFPPEAYFERTGLSEHALPYSNEDFEHRHIVLYEVAGMDSEMLSYFVRTLLSENRITYETVEKTSEGLRSRVIEKKGPTGLLTTTTAAVLHPENETRILSLGVIDSPEQTKAVMAAIGASAVSGGSPGRISQPVWEAFQRWLALGEYRVVVPFAKDLAEEIPPIAVRLRRDFGMLLALVKAHALLHRSTRTADGQGKIIATLADYAAVYALVHKLFAEGIEATVPPTVRATVEAVKAAMAEAVKEISLTALAKQLKLEKSTVSARVHKAIARGFLVNNETKKGLPARIALGDPLPEERQVLPPPEVFEGDCSGVRSESEGVSTRTAFSGDTPAADGAESEKSPEAPIRLARDAERQAETGQKSQKDDGAVPPGGNSECGLYPFESHQTLEHPPEPRPWQDTPEQAAIAR
jgi:hypothetical protein